MRDGAKKALGMMGIAGMGAGLYYGPIFFGIMDYLYQPECFRSGKKPRPQTERAPGKAEIEPSQLRCSQRYIEVILRFTAGPGGISEDGGLKVGLCRLVYFPDGGRRAQFVPAYGWGILQNIHPTWPGYFRVEVKTDGEARLEVEPKPVLPVRFGLRIAGREWLRKRGIDLEPLDYAYLLLEQSKIKVRVREGRLEEGDQVIFHLGDKSEGGRGWRVPSHPISTDFLVEVDERALGLYRSIERPPRLEVLGEPARKLELNLSSPRSQELSGNLRGVDEEGNSDMLLSGLAAVSLDKGEDVLIPLESGRRGTAVRDLKPPLDHPGEVVRLQVRTIEGPRLEGRSNPTAIKANDGLNVYWGDIHAHAALCDGTLGPEDFYLRARDELGLHFASLTCHDHLGALEPSGRTAEEKELLAELVGKFDRDGEFAAFLGYEWTHHPLGHRNVYFSPDEREPVFLSSGSPEGDTLEKLLSRLQGKDCLVIPHHPGWRKMFYLPWNPLKFIRPKLPPAYTWGGWGDLQRLAEIYSSHGCSEHYQGPYPITHGRRGSLWARFMGDDRGEPGLGSYLREAWARGLRLGVVAGSDRHDHAVSEKVAPIMVYPYGLTAVLAESLSSRKIWQALRQRRTYGTTGARILLHLSVNGLAMGSEGELPARAAISISAHGTAPLQSVELVKYDIRGYRPVLQLRGEGDLGTETLDLERDLTDGDLWGDTFYYLRLSQADGHWAWSSPIWLDALS